MPFLAEPINGPNHPWSIEQTPDGYRGTRYYRVNTGNPAEAITAAGLPRRGDHWDALAIPLLQVKSVGPTDTFSHVTGRENDNGWTYVPIYYDTVSAVRLTPHTIYTRTQQSSTVRKGLVMVSPGDPNPASVPWAGQVNVTILPDTPGADLIANGDGATKYFSTLQAEVHCYVALNLPIDFNLLDQAAMEPIVNSDVVRLPPVFGYNIPRTFQPGQVRFDGYDQEILDDRWHFTIRLQLAWNFYSYWNTVDSDGQPNVIKASKLYRSQPLSPLIPWSAG